MEAHRTNSLIISLTLHALIAAIVFFTTYYLAKKAEEPAKIFELVAGPPTDIYSTAAPKKGNSLKIDLPEVQVIEEDNDAGEEAAAAPEPEPATPPPPAKVEAPPPIKTPKVTTKPTPKPAEKTPTKTAAKSDKKISYDEFAKKNPSVKNASKTATKQGTKNLKYKKIDTTGIRDGVPAGSPKSTGGGGGKELTREEMDRMDTYKSYLFQVIRRTAEEDSAGMSDQLLAEVEFDVSVTGKVSNPRIKRGSGSREFDEFALNVFRRLPNLGPPPDRRPHTWSVNFTMDPNA